MTNPKITVVTPSLDQGPGRARLSRFEGSILKAAFPALFRGFAPGEVGDVMTMLPMKTLG